MALKKIDTRCLTSSVSFSPNSSRMGYSKNVGVLTAGAEVRIVSDPLGFDASLMPELIFTGPCAAIVGDFICVRMLKVYFSCDCFNIAPQYSNVM